MSSGSRLRRVRSRGTLPAAYIRLNPPGVELPRNRACPEQQEFFYCDPNGQLPKWSTLPTFAAGAEAAVTGELAVCAGSCGPGNLHLINGLFDCHLNHVPVLAIAAQIPSSEIGLDTSRR